MQTNPYPPDFFSTIDEAKAELERRRNNPELMRKVSDFLGDMLFKQMSEGPRLVLCRDIITPDIECDYFIGKANEIELEPLFLEYSNDKFVARNSDKYHLCNIHFYDKKAKKGQEISKLNVVNFNKWEGKRFNEVETTGGMRLVDLHHKLFSDKYPERLGDVVEFSDWFNSTRHSTDFYYLYFFALFVCHGIWFEDFLLYDKEEVAFTLEKIIPSFEEIKRKFGVKPLIVPIIPKGQEHDLYWWCFPQDLKDKVVMYNKTK